MFYGKENIQIYTGTPDVRKYRHPCCGLSGGADSVCLVAVLKEIIEKEQLDIRLLAVHVNHGSAEQRQNGMSSLRSSFADSYRWNI